MSNDVASLICVKTHISLSRNVGKIPFPSKLGKAKAKHYADKWCDFLETRLGFKDAPKDPEFVHATTLRYGLCPLTQQSRVYRLLCGIVSIDGEKEIAWCEVMNKDHLRFSITSPGLPRYAVVETLESIASAVDDHLHFAYDENFGYLTADMRRIGSGCEVRSCLHLPGLTARDHLRELQNFVTTHRCVLEHDDPSPLPLDLPMPQPGNLFYIRNHYAIEGDAHHIANDMHHLITRIARQEQRIRMSMKYDYPDLIFESLNRMRTFCASANLITEEEALNLISDFWIGYNSGLFTSRPECAISFRDSFECVCDIAIHDVPTSGETFDKNFQTLPARFKREWNCNRKNYDILRAIWLRSLKDVVFDPDFERRIFEP